MELPPYLVLFLWSIKAHGDEPGYLAKRYEGKPYKKVAEARAMVSELFDRRFIVGLSGHADSVNVVDKRGRTHEVPFPRTYEVAPHANHLLSTLLCRLAFWVVAICLAQVVTAAIGATLAHVFHLPTS